MSVDRYCALIRDLCELVGLPDADGAIARRASKWRSAISTTIRMRST
jgi:hypothetical protein